MDGPVVVTAEEIERHSERLRQALREAFPNLEGGSLEREWELDESEPEPSAVPLRLRRAERRPSLFDYQSELAEKINGLVSVGGRSLLSLPTGAGKTRTAVAALLEGMAAGRVRKVAWVAPTRELVEQARETVSDLWAQHGTAPDVMLTPEAWGSESEEFEIMLTTAQNLYARMRRRRELGFWDLVVFDEAHQLGAPTFKEVVGELVGGEPGWDLGGGIRGGTLLGLSATPGRVDERETDNLVELFGGQLLMSERLKPNPIKVLQQRGVLARLAFRRLTDENVGVEDEVTRLLITARASEFLAGRGHRILVFAQSVAGAIVLAEALRSRGVGAGYVHGGLGKSERMSVLRRFGVGSIDVLTNQRLLASGYDCPAVSDVILMGRVGSPILFEQIVGRAARGPKTGGFGKSTVWDFDEHLMIHGLPQSYYRFKEFDWRAS